MPVDGDERRFPSAEEEARFWALLEAAWAGCRPESGRGRQALVSPIRSQAAGLTSVEGALPVFLDALGGLCQGLPGGELVSLDRVLERKLYDIDRADIQRVTDGSDDGFLYARGFIVAMGQGFYNAVASNPDIAVPNAKCEEMCYFFAHLYRERFGGFPDTGSGISRESCSNPSGWPGRPT